MRFQKAILVCGLSLLVAITGGCRHWADELKARDQLNKGVGAFRNAQFQTAIDHFQRAVQLDPAFLNARLYLATAYSQLYIPGGESAENVKVGQQAIAAFEDVLKMEPNNSTALASIGQIYYLMKRFDKAKEYQRRRAELDPNNSEPYYWIGVIDWAQAFAKQMGLRKELNLLNPKDPTKPDLLPSLPAESRDELAKENGPLVDEGIKALEKSLQIKPNDSDAMAYYSLMLRLKSDLEPDTQTRMADLRLAEDWVQKAVGTRKQAAEKAASTGPK
jgi:tetratricopeptide (TPR) repeat protein